MEEPTAATALASDEGEALWFGDFLLVVKTPAERTGERFSVLEQTAAKGAATPWHAHPEDDETMYVVEGELTFYLEDAEPFEVRAGSTVHIPGGAKHAFRVNSETARFVDVTTAQHENFLREAAVPAAERTVPPDTEPDVARMQAAAQRHKVEILGPPPVA
ncbi:cupin domain-containing protein [Actinopolyspora erythraea]|uniref:cupin domain-containing protein n=1 Tax=Actinopolyspora erythraea TaxID=414996 RepID=UPI0006946E48|nr:cupin domain-containing protein [Actinopolyspora erythraea]